MHILENRMKVTHLFEEINKTAIKDQGNHKNRN